MVRNSVPPRRPPALTLCNRALRGWPERDLLIMGTFHPDYAADRSPIHELYVTTEEDSSRA